MHNHGLAALPGVGDHGGAAHVARLLQDVELHQRVHPQAFVQTHQKTCLGVAHILHMAQPVVDQASALVIQCGPNATTVAVAHHDDVLNLQHIDRILDDAQGIEVRVHQKVGHIAVDKQLTREQIDQFVGGHAAVGTAQPHVSGFLLRQ